MSEALLSVNDKLNRKLVFHAGLKLTVVFRALLKNYLKQGKPVIIYALFEKVMKKLQF